MPTLLCRVLRLSVAGKCWNRFVMINCTLDLDVDNYVKITIRKLYNQIFSRSR